MAEHRLIAAYRDDLLRRLPAHLADEVFDGLSDAAEKYLGEGLTTDQAARAAVDEFGNARAVAAAFRRACPAWRAARALIMTGPLVGGWWAAALIADHAWEWPVPVAVRLFVAVVLPSSVILLVVSVLTQRYKAVRRAGIAGCLGLLAVDVSVIATAIQLAPGIRWLLVVAASLSAGCLAFVAGRVHSLVAHRSS